MQNKVNKCSVKQKTGYENKEVSYIKTHPLAHLEYLGGEIIYQERDIKNDSQRLYFEEVHASGRVSTCLSEAYACVLTSKQVLKSLCEL